MISLSMYFSTKSICAFATVLLRFASSDWKLKTVKFSSVVMVECPFQIDAFLPPAENFAI